MATEKSRKPAPLDRRLYFLGKSLNAAQKAWRLIEDCVRILLGLSGGKGSLALMHLRVQCQRAHMKAFLTSFGKQAAAGIAPGLRGVTRR